MRKEVVVKWLTSTRKVLGASRAFGRLCGKPFDRGFVGELLVLERLLQTYKLKLCASDKNGFEYAGSANKGWDVSLTLGGKTIYVNAKSTTTETKKESGYPKWVRQHASDFCDIKYVKIGPKKFIQQVRGKKKGNHDLFYVFVDVGIWKKTSGGTANFYTLPHEEAASICYKKYRKVFHNGRPRKNKSTDFHFEYDEVKKFKDLNLCRILKK
ncbi:MAG: hypothetical protein AAB767_03370 [Patescibacteria group bacterium]